MHTHGLIIYIYIYIYIYIFTFIRRFYPKWLTVYSSYTCFVSMCVPLGIEPTTFALLTQCSNHWATGTLYYSNAHTTCEKVSLRLLPKSHQKSSQSTLVLFTPPSTCFFLLVIIYAIQNSTLPISPIKFSLPTLPEISCHLLTEGKNYRNKPYIAEKRMLSAVRSNLNCLMVQTIEELW